MLDSINPMGSPQLGSACASADSIHRAIAAGAQSENETLRHQEDHGRRLRSCKVHKAAFVRYEGRVVSIGVQQKCIRGSTCPVTDAMQAAHFEGTGWHGCGRAGEISGLASPANRVQAMARVRGHLPNCGNSRHGGTRVPAIRSRNPLLGPLQVSANRARTGRLAVSACQRFPLAYRTLPRPGRLC